MAGYMSCLNNLSFCHFKYTDSNKKCLLSASAFTVPVAPPGKNDCNHTNHNNCKILTDLLDRSACAKTSYLHILRVLCSSGQKGPRFIEAKVLNGERGFGLLTAKMQSSVHTVSRSLHMF